MCSSYYIRYIGNTGYRPYSSNQLNTQSPFHCTRYVELEGEDDYLRERDLWLNTETGGLHDVYEGYTGFRLKFEIRYNHIEENCKIAKWEI